MRISATQLESFRLFMTEDWMSEDELAATIRGEFTPNHKVLLGSAFGKVLEAPDRYRTALGAAYECGGFTFGADMMAPALAVVDRRGIFEAKATSQYGDCTVVAKADHLLGADLGEFKTTLGTYDADNYIASAQWRFIADIFQPARITYTTFLLSEDRNGVIGLRDIQTLPLYPYAGLHADCCALLAEFVDYVTARGLDGVLRERQRLAEAA